MTYPLIGNYGRLVADDQSVRPWLRALVVANATAAVIDDARQLASLLRGACDPGHRRRRHPRPRPPPAGQRIAPGDRDRARRGRSRRRGRGRPGRAALGGPGLRRPGLAGRRSARSATRPRADRSSRSSTSGSRRTSSGRSAGAAPGCASCPTRSARTRRSRPGSTASSSRPDRAIRPGLDGPVALARAAIADGRPLLGICLGHQIVARAAGADTRRLRFGHHGANHPVRDIDSGVVQVTAQNHEVTVVGGEPAGARRVPRQPGEPQRRVRRGAPPPGAADRDGPVPPGGRAGTARRAGRLRPVRRRRDGPGRERTGDRRGALQTCATRPASVLILGSGPVVIGQAAEFDYAGTQACRALRAEGVRTILVNSNPATIMTDPSVADAIYLEPLTVEAVEAVIARERPDGLLAGLGGQTALNLAVALSRAGVFERYPVRLLGTPLEAIEMAEDRERFRDLLDRIGQPYAPSAIVEGATAGGADAHPTRPGPGRDRAAGDRPAGVHPRRDRRRDRRHGGRVSRAGPVGPAGEPHRPGHGRALPRRLAGDRVRGHARRRRHVHRRVLDGERRPARHPHRRLDRRGPGPDPDRRRSTSACGARPSPSSGPSAWRAAATSSSPSRRTRPSTRSSR